VDRWIKNAKGHPVEKINVVGGGFDRVHMGSSIFSSFPTLVVLKLKWVMVVGNVNSVHLPLLKTLHLCLFVSRIWRVSTNLFMTVPIWRVQRLAFHI